MNSVFVWMTARPNYGGRPDWNSNFSCLHHHRRRWTNPWAPGSLPRRTRGMQPTNPSLADQVLLTITQPHPTSLHFLLRTTITTNNPSITPKIQIEDPIHILHNRPTTPRPRIPLQPLILPLYPPILTRDTLLLPTAMRLPSLLLLSLQELDPSIQTQTVSV